MLQEKQRAESLLGWLIALVLGLVYVAQVYACRGLYADGANFLLKILLTDEFPWWDRQRLFNHFITKGPAILAIKLGVHDLVFLRYLFSAWLLACPLLVWGATLWSLRRDLLFWPFVLFFCLIYFSTDFFAVGEFNLCFALLAYSLAGLLRPLPEGRFYRGSLLVAAFFTAFNYPATLFAGSLLFVLTLFKPRAEWNGAPGWYRMALAGCFALSVASALWEVVAPRDPVNFSSARDPTAILRDMQFWYVAADTILIMGMMFVRNTWLRLGMAAFAVGFLLALDFDGMRLYPFFHYAIRSYMALAFTGCCLALWLLHAYGRRLLAATGTPMAPALLATVLLVTLSLLDIGMSLDYAEYLRQLRREVVTHSGLVDYVKSGVPLMSASDRFTWGWSTPLMSIMLRDNARQAVILNLAGYGGYQPFDPYTEIPDLSRYYR